MAWYQSEKWVSHRSDNYYKKANELNLLKDVSMGEKDDVAMRWDVALLLFESATLLGKLDLWNELAYVHETYGYRLVFPKSREGYVSQVQGSDVFFGFPLQKKLFAIRATPLKEWWKYIPNTIPPIYLGENSTHVFSYYVSQEAINQSVINKMEDIDWIIKTFKVD